MSSEAAGRSRRAGRGLSAAGIEWGRPPSQHRNSIEPPSTRGMVVTDRDIEILAALHDYGYLTTSMIGLLFWGYLSDATHRRLKVLHDAGLCDRFRPSAPRRGSFEWTYRLTKRGWVLLDDEQRAADDREYNPALLDYIGYAEHDLQLGSLILDLAHRSADETTEQGPLLDRAGFQWHGPRRGRIDPDQEQLAPQPSVGSKLRTGWTIQRATSRRGVIEPDATLLGISAHTGQPEALLIEYDRTKRPSKQADRFRRYDRFLTESWRDSRYARLPHEPAVLFITAHAAQVESIARAADPHLSAWLGPRNADHADGTYPAREQIAFTSAEHIQDGDWNMIQVPHSPPQHRARRPGARRGCELRTIELALDELFLRSG